MPAVPPNKHQKISKSGWTRKRSSPITTGLSPSLSASANRRLAESRRQSMMAATMAASGFKVPTPQEVAAQKMLVDQARMLAAKPPIDPAEYQRQRQVAAQPKGPQPQPQPARQREPSGPKRREDNGWNFPVPKKHEENPFQEKDYELDIVRYMVTRDNETLASAESMDSQPEVQWYMRPFLLDFLVEVHAQFRLRPEVLYLAINLVDRYVSKRVVYKKHYQLVGCAAMWTAAKFEESKDKVPLVKELTEMCCKAYDESAFVQMEGHVLTTVGWNLGHPTAEAWLRLFNKEAREDQLVQDVTRFLMEITLYHRETVGIQSYDIASGAIILARFICGKPKRVDLFQARAAIFDVHSTERAYRVAYALDYKLHDFNVNVSEVLYRKYTPNHFSRASLICKEWFSNPSNRFSDSYEIASEIPQSSYFGQLHPKSTDSRRGSWMSSSPSASYSCSSSENGDEPLTPNTPVHEGVHPFSAAAAKENVAPTPTRVKPGSNMRTHPPPMIGQKVAPQHPQQTNQTKWTNFDMQQRQAARPALQALPPTGDLAVPRNGPHPTRRRLSN